MLVFNGEKIRDVFWLKVFYFIFNALIDTAGRQHQSGLKIK